MVFYRVQIGGIGKKSVITAFYWKVIFLILCFICFFICLSFSCVCCSVFLYLFSTQVTPKLGPLSTLGLLWKKGKRGKKTPATPTVSEEEVTPTEASQPEAIVEVSILFYLALILNASGFFVSHSFFTEQ